MAVRRAAGSEEEINTGNPYRSEANRSTDLFMLRKPIARTFRSRKLKPVRTRAADDGPIDART